MESHWSQASKRRVVREDQHNTIVDIVGPWIPRHSKEGSNDLYFASLLMLCKPWQGPNNLKNECESWKDAYEAFKNVMPGMKRFASNVQYRYECKDAADKDTRDASFSFESS
jgi:hypothetical protein